MRSRTYCQAQLPVPIRRSFANVTRLSLVCVRMWQITLRVSNVRNGRDRVFRQDMCFSFFLSLLFCFPHSCILRYRERAHSYRRFYNKRFDASLTRARISDGEGGRGQSSLPRAVFRAKKSKLFYIDRKLGAVFFFFARQKYLDIKCLCIITFRHRNDLTGKKTKKKRSFVSFNSKWTSFVPSHTRWFRDAPVACAHAQNSLQLLKNIRFAVSLFERTSRTLLSV